MNAQATEIPSLEGLFVAAKNHADFAIRECSNMPPSLLFFIGDGLFLYMRDGFEDISDKEKFQENIRAICMAYDPSAIVTILESWSSKAKPTKNRPVSKSSNRREVVLLLGESREQSKLITLPILRSEDGNFSGFGKPETNNQVEGRFAQSLPRKILADNDRNIIKEVLKARGVEIIKLQPTPSPTLPLL